MSEEQKQLLEDITKEIVRYKEEDGSQIISDVCDQLLTKYQHKLKESE